MNLAALSLAVSISALGVRRAWPGGAVGRVGSVSGLAVSTFLAAVLSWYCFSFSYGLPNQAAALANKAAGIVVQKRGVTPITFAELFPT